MTYDTFANPCISKRLCKSAQADTPPIAQATTHTKLCSPASSQVCTYRSANICAWHLHRSPKNCTGASLVQIDALETSLMLIQESCLRPTFHVTASCASTIGRYMLRDGNLRCTCCHQIPWGCHPSCTQQAPSHASLLTSQQGIWPLDQGW